MNRRPLFLFLALCLLLVAPAAAQEAVLSGQVLAAADGQPLPGATVAIPALGLEVTSDAQGRYSLTVPAERVEGQTVEVVANFAGLQTSSVEVKLAAGQLSQDFALGVAFPKSPTECHRDAQQFEVVRRDPRALDSFRLTLPHISRR